MKIPARISLLVLLVLPACDAGSDGSPADAARADSALPADTAPDLDAGAPAPDPPAPPDAPAADAGTDPTDAAPPLPDGARIGPRPRPRATADITAPSGWRFARGLIHMHSVHSHDACDGDPKPGGLPNAPCLADLRRSLCHDRFDFTLLTDHPDSVAEVPMIDALLFDGEAGDALVLDEAGDPIGNRLACAEGEPVLLAAGSEGGLMPVLMRRKPANLQHYRDTTTEAAAGLREAGAIILQAHTEKRSFAELDPLGLDGIEIYNLHANVDPRGFWFGEVFPDIARFVEASKRDPLPPHPDLSLLAVLRENTPALATWEQFLPRRRLLGFAGSDIHQNLPPALLQPADGERLDSYRRLGSWFSNYLLIRGVDLDQIREALLQSRLMVVFNLLGEPDGFDFVLLDGAGARAEMGSEVPFAAGQTIRVVPPALPEGVPAEALDVQLLRVTPAGHQTVVQTGVAPIEYVPVGPGVYRVEVRLRPDHLAAELGSQAGFIRPVVWVYTNPIYLR